MDTLSEPAFRLTLGGLLVIGLGLRAYFQRQARGVVRIGRRGGRRDQFFYVLVLGSYLLMFVYVFTPWLDGAQIALPAWARWSGALSAAGGIGLFCWSHLALGANWSGVVELAQGHRLGVWTPKVVPASRPSEYSDLGNARSGALEFWVSRPDRQAQHQHPASMSRLKCSAGRNERHRQIRIFVLNFSSFLKRLYPARRAYPWNSARFRSA